MTDTQKLATIHESLLNGQRRQMVKQINTHYILYDFFAKYLSYLKDCGYDDSQALEYFSDVVISYHRIGG